MDQYKCFVASNDYSRRFRVQIYAFFPILTHFKIRFCVNRRKSAEYVWHERGRRAAFFSIRTKRTVRISFGSARRGINGELLELLEATQVVVWMVLAQSELKERSDFSQSDCKRFFRFLLALLGGGQRRITRITRSYAGCCLNDFSSIRTKRTNRISSQSKRKELSELFFSIRLEKIVKELSDDLIGGMRVGWR